MCDLEVVGAPSIFRVMSSAGDSVRMLPTFDLSCEENTTVVERSDSANLRLNS